jgi:hypothetical protein
MLLRLELRGGAAFPQAGGFATQTAEVIQLCAADSAGSNHVDMVHNGSVQGEDALYALTETHFPNSDSFAHAFIVAGDHGAFECLEAFFIAFLNLYVDTNSVSGSKLRVIRAPVFCDDLSQRWVVH